jgi:hypothetical protein
VFGWEDYISVESNTLLEFQGLSLLFKGCPARSGANNLKFSIGEMAMNAGECFQEQVDSFFRRQTGDGQEARAWRARSVSLTGSCPDSTDVDRVRQNDEFRPVDAEFCFEFRGHGCCLANYPVRAPVRGRIQAPGGHRISDGYECCRECTILAYAQAHLRRKKGPKQQDQKVQMSHARKDHRRPQAPRQAYEAPSAIADPACTERMYCDPPRQIVRRIGRLRHESQMYFVPIGIQ